MDIPAIDPDEVTLDDVRETIAKALYEHYRDEHPGLLTWDNDWPMRREMYQRASVALRAVKPYLYPTIQPAPRPDLAPGAIRIARDEDCPKCGYPETWVEVIWNPEDQSPPTKQGCRACGFTTIL